MAYTDINFRTKKALLAALAEGRTITVYQPGPFGPEVRDGKVVIEGPQYPEPHRWYASAVVKDGAIVHVLGPNGKAIKLPKVGNGDTLIRDGLIEP